MSDFSEDEPTREEKLVIRYGRCGVPVPDESLDRFRLSSDYSTTCRGCSAVIKLKLAEFDAYADSLLFTMEQFREPSRG